MKRKGFTDEQPPAPYAYHIQACYICRALAEFILRLLAAGTVVRLMVTYGQFSLDVSLALLRSDTAEVR